MRWVDIADILLVAFLIYQVYKLMRGSVGFRIFIGIISIYLLYLLVKAIGMGLLTAILGQFIGVGVIAALIIFQQEIRKFLLLIGKTSAFNNDRFFKSFFKKEIDNKGINMLAVIEAAKSMSGTNTGALIVFAKSSELKFYAESGDMLDALISKRLLISIFYKNSPMHDGAVIIANGRIKAARCILPISENADLPAHYGLRHRAAIGISEVTDSIVLVISEETGQMSLAYNGEIENNLSASELRTKINLYLYETTETLDALKPEEVKMKIAAPTH